MANDQTCLLFAYIWPGSNRAMVSVLARFSLIMLCAGGVLALSPSFSHAFSDIYQCGKFQWCRKFSAFSCKVLPS